MEKYWIISLLLLIIMIGGCSPQEPQAIEEEKASEPIIPPFSLSSCTDYGVNSYNIENTRLGHRIDYEKLSIEVETDGSVTPDDALTYAAKILKDHIQLFINFDIEPEEEEPVEVDEEILQVRKLLKMPVDELELSVRSYNCLMAANIKTIGDLVKRDEQEMLKFRNFGRKSLQELNKILEEKDLQFGMDTEKYLKGDTD